MYLPKSNKSSHTYGCTNAYSSFVHGSQILEICRHPQNSSRDEWDMNHQCKKEKPDKCNLKHMMCWAIKKSIVWFYLYETLENDLIYSDKSGQYFPEAEGWEGIN